MEEELRMLRSKDAQSSSIAELKQQMDHVQREYDSLSDMYQKSLKQVLDLTSENNSLRSQLEDLSHKLKTDSFDIFLKLQKDITAKFIAKTLNESHHLLSPSEEHTAKHNEIQQLIAKQSEVIAGLVERIKSGELLESLPADLATPSDPVAQSILQDFAEKTQLIHEVSA